MRLLLVNHYAGSPRHGMEFRPYYLAREWVRAGHEVTIVAASHSHVRAVQPEMDGQPREELIDGIRYRWLPVPTYHGNGVGRLRNILSFLRQLRADAWRLTRELRPDAVAEARKMSSATPQATLRILEGHGHICLIAPDLDLSTILEEWTDRR